MASALNMIKLIGAWGCLAAAVAIAVFTNVTTGGLPLMLTAMSIAFSLLPNG